MYGELAWKFDLNDGDDRCSSAHWRLPLCKNVYERTKKKKILNIFATAARFRRHKSISAIGTNSTLAAAILVWHYDLTAEHSFVATHTRHSEAIISQWLLYKIVRFFHIFFSLCVFDRNFNCPLNGSENDLLGISVKFNCQINVYYNMPTGNNNM